MLTFQFIFLTIFREHSFKGDVLNMKCLKRFFILKYSILSIFLKPIEIVNKKKYDGAVNTLLK